MILQKKHDIDLSTYKRLCTPYKVSIEVSDNSLDTRNSQRQYNYVIVLRNDDVIDFQNENLAIILSKSVHVHNQ